MKTENKNVYILSCEAKDLYDSNNYITPNKIGYNIRRKDGQINFKKFKNSLDYSIEKIELGKIYQKQVRNKKFSFVYKGKQYSQQVINVNFSYSYNIFNKTFKGVYVKAGYYYGDLEFNDCICIKDNQLIGIEIKKEVENPIEESLLEGYFKVVEIEDKNGIHYEYDKVKDFEVIKNPTELRKYLYKNGFYCDGIKYVRYKRSAGSSRVGKCLFVNEVLYDRIHKYELCGLNIKYGDEIDLAAFEAYIALTTSSIIDTITIKPENILLIPDFESSFNDNVVKVTYENNQLETKVENTTINNSLFDGQSLLDSSFFEKYDNKGMLLLRNRFFKSACFNTNIQEFFKDNDIKFVWQLKGKTLANNIEDIKLITTPSSIKYLKFGKFNDWLKNIDETFGIVKHEKPTHYFGGRLVSTHYQLINTLQLNEKEIDLVLNDSFNYIKAINNDLATLKYHIHYPTPSEKISSMKTKNDIVFKLLGLNEDFSKTKIFKEFKDSLIKSLIKEIRQGHILVNGNYSTLFGNGYEMLQHSIGATNNY